MKLAASKILRISYAKICVTTLMLGSQVAFAVAYVSPTPGFVVPLSIANGDTVTVNSGTVATPSSSSISYTINFSSATAAGVTITVNNSGTIGYNGTNGAGAAISSTRNSAVATTNNIIVNAGGALDAGSGLYGIYLNNANVAPNDSYIISNKGVITGAILSSGVKNLTLSMDGPSANVIGTITLGVVSGSSILNVQNGANFAPVEQIANIGNLNVLTGSSMTFNTLNANIRAVTINAGGTINVNYPLVGATVSDGNITNNGTMNIANDISKTGAFTGSGTNVVSEPVTVTTSNYTVNNHVAAMKDVSNFGNMNLSTATFAASNFSVTYSGGYLPGNTYTLVSAPTVNTPTFGSIPGSTMFLNFSSPTVVGGNKIQMLITRNPFNSFATTTMTQEIGASLEAMGNNNPSASMLSLLNAVEASTNPNAVEYSLRQLAPLSSAPLYGLQIQDTTMYQAELRLASLRDQKYYIAGDIARDNHAWVRPFGTYANQQAKDDSLGYYGSSGGITAGFDRNLGENYVLGASGGYVLSHVNDKINPESSTKIKSYLAMIYGSYDFTETRYLDWIFAVIDNEFSAERMVNINGYQQLASSSYSSQQFSLKGLWAKDYSAFNFMQLTPQATAQYTYSKQYTYQESGANAANLNISRTNSNIVQLALGGKVAVPLWLNPSIVIPEVHAMFFYNPIVGQQNTIFNFIDGGGQSTSFFSLNRTGLVYGAALTIAVVDKLEVKFNLDVDVEDRFNGYTAYLNLRYLLGC